MREENYTVIKTVVYPHYLDYYTSGAANSNAFRGRGSTYINEESRKHTSYPKRGDHHLAWQQLPMQSHVEIPIQYCHSFRFLKSFHIKGLYVSIRNWTKQKWNKEHLTQAK